MPEIRNFKNYDGQDIEDLLVATDNSPGLLDTDDKIKLNKIKAFNAVIVENTTIEPNDIVDNIKFTAGANITLTGNDNNNEIEISATDTTYDLSVSKNATNGNVKLNLTATAGNDKTDTVIINGTGSTTVTTDANGIITINSTDFQDQITEINEILDDLLYKAITFTKFTNNIGTVELGSTVNSVTLTWETNKKPTTLKLDNTNIDTGLKTYTYNNLALKPTSVTTKTYTIVATDERNASANKSTSLSFVNGVYYGVIDESATIDSSTVLDMTRKLQNSRGMTVTITPSSTEYIAFAFPSRLGTPTFKMGGFETTCNCTTIQFTNASGFTEAYNVYTTANTGLGKTEVVVS